MRERKQRRTSALGVGLGNALIGLLALAALLPVAGLGVRLVASGLPPFAVDGDHALIEIATRQAAAGERLLGPYSRLGFHHPGPALFYFFAPFFAASGGSYLALCLAMVVLNLAAFVVVLGALARSGPGVGLGWPSLVLAVYALFLEPGVLVSPWNPHAILLPLLATLVAAAAVMAGRDIWLPAAVAGASLVLESHIGLLPVLAATAVLTLFVRARLRPPTAVPERPGLARASWSAATVIAVFAWLPVGLEAALNRGGNLLAIADFLRHRQGGQPLAAAARTVFAHIGAPLVTPWGATLRDNPGGVTAWLGLAIVVATAVALPVAMRRRRPFGAALAATGVVSVGAAVFAATSVVGPLHDYLVGWVTVLAPLALLALGEALRPEPATAHAHRLPSLILGLALAATATVSWRATLAWHDVQSLQSSERFALNRCLGEAAVAEAARARTSGVTIVPVESEQWGTVAAVAARLLAAGYPVSVGSRWGGMFGLPRSPQPQDLRLAVAAGGDEMPADVAATCGGFRLVRLEPRPLPAGELIFGGTAVTAYLLDGFDTAEGSVSDGFRWMVGRRGRILLPVADRSDLAVIAIEMAPLAVPGTSQEVTVTVDGRLAGTASRLGNGFGWYRFAMPYRSGPDVAVLQLDAAWALSPFELERALDVRPLSVRIRQLHLEPAARVPPAPQPPPG